MRMRRKPLRGENYTLVNGTNIIIIEVLKNGNGDLVSVILPNGKITSVPKNEINLPRINTRDYEKVDEPAI